MSDPARTREYIRWFGNGAFSSRIADPAAIIEIAYLVPLVRIARQARTNVREIATPYRRTGNPRGGPMNTA